jgi:hypothetical protein
MVAMVDFLVQREEMAVAEQQLQVARVVLEQMVL